MCGISGIFEPSKTAVIDSRVVKAMTDTLYHRGPDDEGFYCGSGIGLGHRRLSIIDLKGGHQPLANEDQTVWIVFNGEIYNFEELNRRYLANRHRFRTRSDTETIVHLYEELGEACFGELRGMFALALWDARNRKLLLARDRLGKKPLFYSWDGSRIVFGSEIKAISAVPGISREIDLEALSDYFSYQYVPAPKTIYRQVRKLKAAHYLAVDRGGLREVPYWDLRFDQSQEASESEWCERLLGEYRTSVKARLVSDVPLGAFLSGGVDSSSVVAMMNEIQSPVTTCSIGFSEESYDETAQAREFAQALRTTHHEQRVTPKALDLVRKLAWHYDEPFADSSAVPTYYVCRMARQYVTVALSGDGGDENFAGYGRYKTSLKDDRLRSFLPGSVRQPLFNLLGRCYPRMRWAPRMFRAKSVFQSLARSPIEGYFNQISCCPPDLKRELLAPEIRKQLRGYDSIDVLRTHWDRANTDDPLSRLQYLDIKTYLADDILVKVDRASMANSLEVRCPLLDHKLMELLARIPASLKLQGGHGKYIFKRALQSKVPASVLHKRKQGFAMPVAEWFRGELKQHAYQALIQPKDELLNGPFLKRCWVEHQQGQRDWSALLWCVLMFRAWQDVSQTV